VLGLPRRPERITTRAVPWLELCGSNFAGNFVGFAFLTVIAGAQAERRRRSLMKARRIIALAVTTAACLFPLTAAAQDLPAGPDANLTVEHVGYAFASTGFQVDQPVCWEWTSPPVSRIVVRDLTRGRVLMALVYPSTAAALSARTQARAAEPTHTAGGPSLVQGYGESVWVGNVALVQTTLSDLEILNQMLVDRENCLDVDPERLEALRHPHVTVDADFLQALTTSFVNL